MEGAREFDNVVAVFETIRAACTPQDNAAGRKSTVVKKPLIGENTIVQTGATSSERTLADVFDEEVKKAQMNIDRDIDIYCDREQIKDYFSEALFQTGDMVVGFPTFFIFVPPVQNSPKYKEYREKLHLVKVPNELDTKDEATITYCEAARQNNVPLDPLCPNGGSSLNGYNKYTYKKVKCLETKKIARP